MSDTIDTTRRAEAARWMPASEWYPRTNGEFAGEVGRYMLFVQYDGGYDNAEFCSTREEAEKRAPWIGSSHGGYCRAILDLDTGDWFMVDEVRTVTLVPSTADDMGYEPEEVEA